MIADFARVANGKLDVIGGGWSMMNAQGPFGFFAKRLGAFNERLGVTVEEFEKSIFVRQKSLKPAKHADL